MTKRHFIALADRLRGLDVPKPVLDALVAWCKSENGQFDEYRWREYLAGNCGPSGGKRKKAVA